MAPTIFTTHEQLRQALFHLGTLDQHQLDAVYHALLPKLSGGGLTAEEFKKVVRQLRLDNVISEIDKVKLLSLID